MNEQEAADKYVGQMNAVALRDYAEATRKLMRECLVEVETLKGLVLTQREVIEQHQSQIGMLQARVLGGRATGGS